MPFELLLHELLVPKWDFKTKSLNFSNVDMDVEVNVYSLSVAGICIVNGTFQVHKNIYRKLSSYREDNVLFSKTIELLWLWQNVWFSNVSCFWNFLKNDFLIRDNKQILTTEYVIVNWVIFYEKIWWNRTINW